MEILVVLVVLGVVGYFFYKGRSLRLAQGIDTVGIVPSDDTWPRSFALYYIASELRYRTHGELPDTVGELLTEHVSGTTEQSMLVNLQTYLSFAYQRDRGPDDYGKAVAACRALAREEMELANSPVAFKAWIRKTHKSETNKEITEAELTQLFTKMKRTGNADKSAALRLQGTVFKGQIESLFEAKHGRPISEFADDVLKSFGSAL